MKLLQLGLFTLALSLIGLQASAGPVAPASVTTFQSGSPLLSSEVNATLNALITAIDDNASRVAALEAAASAPLDVSDRQYCVAVLNSGFWVGDTPAQVGVTQGSVKAGLVLSAGGTGTFTSYLDNFKEAFDNLAVIDASEPLGSLPITWTLTGNLLAIDFGGGDIEKAMVSGSGELIVGGNAFADRDVNNTGTWHSSEIFVMNEVSDASTCNLTI